VTAQPILPADVGGVAFFSSWPAESLAAIAPHIRPALSAAGDEIFSEKSPGDTMYFIKEGTVEIYRRQGPLDDTIALLHDGVTFGEMTFLDGSPRSAAARAVTPVTAYAFDRAGYAALCAAAPHAGVQFLDGLLKILVERLRQADYNIAVLYTAVKEL